MSSLEGAGLEESVSQGVASFAEAVLGAGPEGSAALGMVLHARTVRWVVGQKDLGVVAKVYRAETGWSALVVWLRGTRARRAARTIARALRRGVPVPRVRFVHEAAEGSVLVMDFVEAKPLRDAFAARSGANKRELLRRVARFVAGVHAARLYPSDFNDTNIVIRADGSPVLIDPDGLRPVLWVSERRRVRNLERLLRGFLRPHAIPLLSRFRFLVEYLGGNTARRRRQARGLFGRVARRFSVKQRQYSLQRPDP